MTDPVMPPTAVGPWLRRSRETVYANPWIEVLHDDVVRPDGSPGVYGVVHFRNLAVGVVAVADDGRILLVGQHRYTLDAYSWEIPEGGAAPDESPEAGARRELAEETGFEADTWRELCRCSAVQLGDRRAGRPVRRDRAAAGGGQPGAQRGPRRPVGDAGRDPGRHRRRHASTTS